MYIDYTMLCKGTILKLYRLIRCEFTANIKIFSCLISRATKDNPDPLECTQNSPSPLPLPAPKVSEPSPERRTKNPVKRHLTTNRSAYRFTDDDFIHG